MSNHVLEAVIGYVGEHARDYGYELSANKGSRLKLTNRTTDSSITINVAAAAQITISTGLGGLIRHAERIKEREFQKSLHSKGLNSSHAGIMETFYFLANFVTLSRGPEPKSTNLHTNEKAALIWPTPETYDDGLGMHLKGA